MTETREGWALTSNGRNYRKVTGVTKVEPASEWRLPYCQSKERHHIPLDCFFTTEQQAAAKALEAVKVSVEKARKQLANAEKDEARLMKRMKELGA